MTKRDIKNTTIEANDNQQDEDLFGTLNAEEQVFVRDVVQAQTILSGQDPYILPRVMQYLYNFYRNTEEQSDVAYRFCYAFQETYGNFLPGFPALKDEKKKPARYQNLTICPSGIVDNGDWEKIGAFLEEHSQMPEGLEQPMALQALHALADHLNIDDDARALMEFSHIAVSSILLVSFFQIVLSEDRDRRGAGLAYFMDQPERYKEFGKTFDYTHNPLMRHSILLDDQESPIIMPVVNPAILDSVTQAGLDTKQLVSRLTGEPLSTDLEIKKDFTHLGQPLKEMLAYLRAAVKQDTHKGVNIVIYGPSGSGKTELAKAIAKELKCSLYAAGENLSAHIDDLEMTSRKRSRDLRSKDALLAGAKNTILLFEELEDMLIKGDDSSKRGDMDNKVELLRMLDDNKVVTIYTCNDIERFQEPVKNRFKYALYVDYPPPLVRQNIWKRQCELQGLRLSAQDTLDLARKYAAAPRMIANAVDVAKTLSGGRAEVEQALRASAKVVYGVSDAIEIEERVPKGFNPRTVNLGNGGQEKIRDLIARGQRGHAFSLFMHAPKGAGGGGLLRYVGENLSMNVMEASMEHLSRPSNVATPEMRIKQLFDIAEDNNQFLIVGDIEHLMDNPRGDRWEEGLTSVFLKAASSHKRAFAMTSSTKKFADLPADMQFIVTDDLQAGPLTEKMARDAYKRIFNRPAPKALGEYKNLLPGDFSEVSRLAARYGNDGLGDEKILDLFRKRLDMRKATVRQMGFGAALRRD